MDELEALEREHLRLRWMVADLKLHLMRREFARKAGFNPDEPRDELGRWTGDGSIELSSARKIPPIVREFGQWTVRRYVSQKCAGSINAKVPGEFEDASIAEVWKIAKGGDARARTCLKLLKEPRFKK